MALIGKTGLCRNRCDRLASPEQPSRFVEFLRKPEGLRRHAMKFSEVGKNPRGSYPKAAPPGLRFPNRHFPCQRGPGRHRCNPVFSTITAKLGQSMCPFLSQKQDKAKIRLDALYAPGSDVYVYTNDFRRFGQRTMRCPGGMCVPWPGGRNISLSPMKNLRRPDSTNVTWSSSWRCVGSDTSSPRTIPSSTIPLSNGRQYCQAPFNCGSSILQNLTHRTSP